MAPFHSVGQAHTNGAQFLFVAFHASVQYERIGGQGKLRKIDGTLQEGSRTPRTTYAETELTHGKSHSGRTEVPSTYCDGRQQMPTDILEKH